MGVDQTTIDGDAKLLGVRKGAKCESSKFTISTILLTYIATMYTSARALLLVQNDFFFRQSHQLELAALTKRADVFATKRALLHGHGCVQHAHLQTSISIIVSRTLSWIIRRFCIVTNFTAGEGQKG